MTMQFTKAEKAKAKLRLAISGPSGSGKTYTALAIATELGDRVAVIDTENDSASLYADRFDFERLSLTPPYDPLRFVEAIEAAEAAGFDVLVIDSLSHEWNGKGGCLEMVDAAKSRYGGNSHYAWAEVTPKHNELVEKINRASLHVIATMRSKTTWAEERDDRGKVAIKKLGMAPVQREGLEYEFTLYAEMDLENTMIVSKSRCFDLQNAVIKKPGKEVADTLKEWLDSGVDPRRELGDLTDKASALDLTDEEREKVTAAAELALNGTVNGNPVGPDMVSRAHAKVQSILLAHAETQRETEGATA